MPDQLIHPRLRRTSWYGDVLSDTAETGIRTVGGYVAAKYNRGLIRFRVQSANTIDTNIWARAYRYYGLADATAVVRWFIPTLGLAGGEYHYFCRLLADTTVSWGVTAQLEDVPSAPITVEAFPTYAARRAENI